MRESRVTLVGFSGEVNYPLGVIDLSVTMEELDKLRMVIMEFVVVKCHSPYNVILGRTRMRSLGAMASSIHSMIKFPTANGIATMGYAPRMRPSDPKEHSAEEEVEVQAKQFPEEKHPKEAKFPPLPERRTTLDKRGKGEDKLAKLLHKLSLCRRRKLEAYMDEMVIKSKTEPDLIKDIKETLLTLKKGKPRKDKSRNKHAFPKQPKANVKHKWKACRIKQEMKKSMAELPMLTALMKDEEVILYLSTANEAVSANCWWREMEGKCRFIIREASRRFAKWLVELGAYGITYAPRNAIKGQVLDDFLADTVTRDNPTSKGTLGLEKPSDQKEILESSKSKKGQMATDSIEEVDTWKLYIDGASNDLGSGARLILIDPEGVEYSYALRLNLNNSNNDIEYDALQVGLRIATRIKVEKMHAFVDSKLVANQVEGSYEARGKKQRNIQKIPIIHISREENKKAKALNKLATVQCEGLTKGVLVEELSERSIDMVEITVIFEEKGRTWMTPIRE
nr:hypothetical protein [Tanacetum cinerariifolium]